MIVFDGYLTGAAEKYFHKRSRRLGQCIIFISILLIAPGILTYAIRSNDTDAVFIFGCMSICFMLFTFIPKGKKERKEITPKRIVIEDEYVACIAEKYTESRMINEVKLVKDFGEYYELCFSFGKLSDKFICQKSLLKRGSIQDFEMLFKGKINNQVKLVSK